MNSRKSLELKVGIFVGTGVLMFCAAVILLGGTKTWFEDEIPIRVSFESVEGLIPGAKVMSAGLQIGQVRSVEYSPKSHLIDVDFEVYEKHIGLVKTDSLAEIATQGVLGDKYLIVSPGGPDLPQIPPGTTIKSKEAGGLGAFVSQGENLMVSLNSIAGSLDRMMKALEKNKEKDVLLTNLAQSSIQINTLTTQLNQKLSKAPLDEITRNLNEILLKINKGKGSLGAFINDPLLYDETKALMGGLNRNRIFRNLVRGSIQSGEASQSPNKE